MAIIEPLSPIEQAIAAAIGRQLEDGWLDNPTFSRMLKNVPDFPERLRELVVTIQHEHPQITLPFLIAAKEHRNLYAVWPEFLAWLSAAGCASGYGPILSVMWRAAIVAKVDGESFLDDKLAGKKKAYAEMAEALLEIMGTTNSEDAANVPPRGADKPAPQTRLGRQSTRRRHRRD